MSANPTPAETPEPAIWLCDSCNKGGLEESRVAALDAIQAHLQLSTYCGVGRRGFVVPVQHRHGLGN